jgi:SpoVK/Ycf46/Vps4 family AAA+-type ATPase
MNRQVSSSIQINSSVDGEKKYKLLRLSDFCSKQASVITISKVLGCGASHSGVRVRLSTLTCSPHNSNEPDDEFSMVYVSDVDTLIEWSIMERSLCWLVNTASPKRKQVPVQIQVMQDSSHPSFSSSSPTLYVPPCVAASIGSFTNQLCNNILYECDLIPFYPTTISNASSLPIACEVTLQEVGKSPYDILERDDSNIIKSIAAQDEDYAYHIQCYFHRKPRLLSQYCIFGIDIGSKGNTRKPNYNIKFFEISSHVIASKSALKTSQSKEAFLVNQETRIILTQTSTLVEEESKQHQTTTVRRLPYIPHAQSFYQSIMNDSATLNTVETPSYPVCSTNLTNLIDFLMYSTNGGTTTATRCIHIHVNDEDQDNPFVDVDALLSRYIEVAAHAVGVRYLTIDGLAAFHYRYNNNPKQHQSTNIIAEKISGLQKALSICQRVQCILHVSNFHEEFFYHHQGQYDDINQDILDRIKTCLDEMSTKHSFVVPIIFSSSSKYQHKYSRFSAFPSILLSFLPNNEEIETFWNNQLSYHIGKRVVFDQIKQLLEGRNEQEILTACQICTEKINPTTSGVDDEDIPSLLSSILDDLDASKRHASNKMKNLNKNSSTAIIPSVHWKDIGGLSNVKNEIRNAIEIPLKYPHLFPTNEMKRSGLVLWGPPGSGKTMVAKAVATECGLPFLSVKGPELLGSFVGESEANVRKVFETARTQAAAYHKTSKTKAAVLFFDELDSLAPRRRIDVSGNSSGSSDVMDRVVATLLGELDEKITSKEDGDDNEIKIFVIGATNRPDLLDPALLRPGRLDRRVYLGFPTNEEDRIQILNSQLQKFPLGDTITEETIRQITHRIPPNLTGADFSAISSGALLRSLHRRCKEIEREAENRLGIGDTITSEAYEDCIQQVMEEWEECDESLLRPLVTLDDLMEASQSIVPSVSLEDKEKYEAMNKRFCS